MEKEVLNSEITEQKANDSVPFYSYRKVIKCLSDGISLYTDNIRQFTRLTLPFVLPISLIAAVFAAVTEAWLIVVGMFWIVFCCPYYRCISYAFVIKKCIVKKEKLTFADLYKFAWRKSPRMVLFAYVVQWLILLGTAFCVLPFCWTPESTALMIVKVVLLLFAVLVQLLLFLPTETAVPSVMLERGNVFKDFFTGYKYGMMGWLRLFTLTVLVNIILVFAVALIGAPMLVLSMIDVSSAASMNLGDSVTFPAGYAITRAVMAFLSVFILIYICTAVRFAFVYFYASTKADMKEREKNEIPLV